MIDILSFLLFFFYPGSDTFDKVDFQYNPAFLDPYIMGFGAIEFKQQYN